MASCSMCHQRIGLSLLIRKTLAPVRDPWADFSCPSCGGSVEPSRGRVYATSFLSLFISLLVPPAIRERGGGLALQLAGFTAVLLTLRILATLLYHFVPRRSRDGQLPE